MTSSSPLIRAFTIAALAAVALVEVFPYLWMLSTSLKDLPSVTQFPPTLLPHPPRWDNYAKAWSSGPFLHYAMNNVIQTLGILVLQLFFGCLAFTRMGGMFYEAVSTVQSRANVFGQWTWFRQWQRRQNRFAYTRGAVERAVSLLTGVPVDVRALLVKDIRVFWRDTTQWGQTLVLFGLLAAYIINLRHFSQQLTNPFWVHLVSYLNLGACSLNLATLTTRFVYSQFSLEGKRLWIVGLAPLGLVRVVRTKYWLASVASLFVTLGLIWLSCHMLKLPLERMAYYIVAVSIMTAIQPDLAERWSTADLDGFRRRLSAGLRAILVVLLPAAVGYLVLARPIIALVLGHGAVGVEGTRSTASTMALFAVGIPGFSAYLFLMRAYQAMQDTRTAFFMYLIENGINIVLAFALYRPLGRGLFEDVAVKAGLGAASRNSLGFGCAFADFDLDGDLDFVVANGHIDETVRNIRGNVGYAQPPHLFINQGGVFRDSAAAAGAGFAQPRVGRGLACADFDRDGDVDLLVTTNNGPAVLFRNDQSSGNRFVRFRLFGTASNRDAIGATVRVFHGGTSQSRLVKSGSSYLSQSELPVTFGVGLRDRLDRVVVSWPNGRTEEFKAVATGKAYDCVEGKGMLTP